MNWSTSWYGLFNPAINWTGGWVDSRNKLDMGAKRPILGFIMVWTSLHLVTLTDWTNPPHIYKLTFQFALTLKRNTRVPQLQCCLTIQVCSLVCLSTVSLRNRSHCCCILSRSRWRLRVSLLPLPPLRWADRESMSWPLLSSMITSCSLLITSLYIG